MADCSSNGASNENGSSASGSGEFFGDKYSNDTQQDGDIDEDSKEINKSLKSSSNWKQRKYESRHRDSTTSSSSNHPFELYQLQQHHGHFRDMGSNTSSVSGVYNIGPRSEYYHTEGPYGSYPPEPYNSYKTLEIEKNCPSPSQTNIARSSQVSLPQIELPPNTPLVTSKEIKPTQKPENVEAQGLPWINSQESPLSPHRPNLRRIQPYNKSIESTRSAENDNQWKAIAAPPLRSPSPSPSPSVSVNKIVVGQERGDDEREVQWVERPLVPLLYSPILPPPTQAAQHKHDSDQDEKQPRRRMATRSSKTNPGSRFY
ncbi:hypothetical protein F4703DRAFT_1205072 [Phycomyces blakesleeanus]